MNTAVDKYSTSEIFDDLHVRLVTTDIPPGEKLKSEELRTKYGCSGNTIREILFRLANVGLVRFEEQRGFRATPSTPEHRHDVTRFRIMLEQEATQLSMQRGGIEWESRLSATHYKLKHIEHRIEEDAAQVNVIALWSKVEWEFHDTLTSNCGSSMMRATYRNVYDQFRQQVVGLERDFGRNYFDTIVTEHQAILDAVLAGNKTACQTAIFDHLKRNLN